MSLHMLQRPEFPARASQCRVLNIRDQREEVDMGLKQKEHVI